MRSRGRGGGKGRGMRKFGFRLPYSSNWTLDGAGNWNQLVTVRDNAYENIDTFDFARNSFNQYHHLSKTNSVDSGSDIDADQAFDPNGNQTFNALKNQHYYWSAFNRLVKVTDGEDNEVVRFLYDADGRRVRKITGGGGDGQNGALGLHLKDDTGMVVAWTAEDGILGLTRDLVQNAGTISLDPNVREWYVKNNSGAVVARIALSGAEAGRMWIKGQKTTGPSRGDIFHIQDPSNPATTIVSISQNGDLHLLATDRLQEGSSPNAFSGHEWTWDGWRNIEEYDNGAQSPNRQFTYGSYLDEHLTMDVNENGDNTCIDSGDSRYFYHQSLNYSVLGLTDINGNRKEAYEYTPYGEHILLIPAEGDNQVRFDATDTLLFEETSSLGNPFMYTGQRFDSETWLRYFKNRYLANGSFLSRDFCGYIDSPHLYQYANYNPIYIVDPFGNNLYAIDGTWAKQGDGSNTNELYNRSNEQAGFWNGPKDGPNGTDSILIKKNVIKKVCADFCKDQLLKINFVGWSRGAAMLIEIAQTLNDKGCSCCGKWYKPFSGIQLKPIPINWMGLFDAVDMSIGAISTSSTVPPNVMWVSHAMKSEDQIMFPTIQYPNNMPGSRMFWRYDGSPTTHNDIGRRRDNNGAFNWMVEEARNAGISIGNGN